MENSRITSLINYRLNVISQSRSPAMASALPAVAPKPKLLDRVRLAIRTRHYSSKTEEAYVGWIRRFILFHNKRHPSEMGEAVIGQFLSSLARDSHVSASTQNQALNALLFLYQVLEKKIGLIQGVVRAKRPRRLLVVLTQEEVRRVLSGMKGTPWLMAMLLYGGGLRRQETSLTHLQAIRQQHERDLREGWGVCRCRTLLNVSIPVLRKNGDGNGCSPPPATTPTGQRGSGADTIFTNPCYNGHSKTPGSGREYSSPRAATHCAIRLGPISWRPATTSGQFRNC
jgi:hypothetical protein